VPAAAPAILDGPIQLSRAMIDRVASDHSRELSKCDGGEQLHGEITVMFSVDPGGKVSKAQVATAIKKHKVSSCILGVVQKWQFPKPGPTGAKGAYTVSFQ
jgi:TonB family protein